MKNIQVIDSAENCVYDIFAATEDEYSLLFPPGQDVAFIGEVFSRVESSALERTLSKIWTRRVRKCDAMGIHGLLFYGFETKAKYYPTRRDEDALNPDFTSLHGQTADEGT